MSEIFFKAFRPNTNDVWNWDRYIYYWKLREDLSETDRLLTISAIILLKSELRKEFLKDNQKTNHPIAFHVHNKAEDSRLFLIWLSTWLDYFKKRDCNYHELLKQLKPAKSAKREGISLVDIASVYAAAGFEVVFKPELQGVKNPDIKIVNPSTGESFFIDVTFLENRKENEEVSLEYRILHNAFHHEPPFFEFSCKLLKRVKEENLQSILDQIHHYKIKTQKEQSFETLSNEYLELAIAHKSKEEELKLWCKERERAMDLIGLSLDFDETERIKGNKIKEKAQQVSDSGWGLIYIQVHPLYFLIKNPAEIIERLEPKLNEFSKVLGIVIYSRMGHNLEKEVHIESFHVYSKKMKFSSTQEDLIFIANSNCEVEISEDTLVKIYKTF